MAPLPFAGRVLPAAAMPAELAALRYQLDQWATPSEACTALLGAGATCKHITASVISPANNMGISRISASTPTCTVCLAAVHRG